MRQWATGLLIGCWSIVAGLGYGQPVPAPLPDAGRAGVEVLHASDLAEAGLVRLSDLFSLLDDWYALSIDGFTWRAAPNGLAPTHQARWLLFVDGTPLDLSIFDDQNLNLAPIHISQVDSVVIHSVPTLIGGRVAGAGVLHLYTRRPEGLTARAGTMVGNEIDDPGPYSFTDRATRNVDRVGPGYVAALGYGSPAVGLEATYLQDFQHVTKRPQWDRVFGVYGRPHGLNRVMLQTVGLTAYARRKRSRHHLLAGYSRFRDYRFLDPLGFDIATDRRTPHVGLNGSVHLGPTKTLSYEAGYTRVRLGEWANRVDHTFGWTQDRLHSHLAVAHQRRGLHLTTGFSSDLHASRPDTTTLTRATVRTQRLYQQIGGRVTSDVYQEIALVGLLSGRSFGFEALATTAVQIAPQQRLDLTASIASTPPADVNSLWYWLAQGYSVPWQDRTSLLVPDARSRRRTTTLDATWRLASRSAWTLYAGGGWRRFRGATDADIVFGYVDPDQIFRGRTLGATVVRTGLRGQILRSHLGGTHRLGRGFQHRIHYAFQHVVAGNTTVAQAWSRQPAHLLRYRAGYAPFPGFSLHGQGQFQSATTWPGYTEAAQATNGFYRTRLPAFVLVDLAVRKTFWRDHLLITLLLRNVLNAPYRTHPAGPETRLTFFVQAQLRL